MTDTDNTPPDIYAVMNRRLVPYGVSVELTARCNLDCIHCYHVRCGQPELDTAEVFGLLDDLAALGTMELTFSGGEPLLLHDFARLLEYAVKTGGFSVKIFSNLTLMTPALADLFASLPLNSVETTLLGPDAPTHDAIARRPGSFEDTVRGITLLRDRSVRVSAKTIVMTANLPLLDDMYALASDLGIPFRHDDGVFVESDGSRGPLSLQVNENTLKRLRRRRGAPAIPPASLCNIGKSVMSVSPDGSVYPCGPFPASAGNIRQRPLKEIWADSPVMRAVRSLAYEDYAVCRTCPYIVRCGGCVAMGLGLSRGRKYPCRLARKRLRFLT